MGCKIILGGKGQNTFDEVVRKLDEGYHVCLLSDRHVGKSGVGVEFFNNMAAFPKGPAHSFKNTAPYYSRNFSKER